MSSFDPDRAAAPDSGAFGLDDTPESAGVHLFGVPVEATTSYRRGTRNAPLAILEASRQVDLEDLLTGRPYEAGIYWHEPLARLAEIEREASEWALPVIEAGGLDAALELADRVERVDLLLDEMNGLVYEHAQRALATGKLFGLVGGDHSTPLGAIRAHAEAHAGLGILHVDAHLDLRDAYEGFRNSHASILKNVLATTDVAHCVSVGIRDVGASELELFDSLGPRMSAVFAHDWARARGRARLESLVQRAIEPLPQKVYVTFDVDGLDPTLCPNTGTPVPGGLLWDEANDLLAALVASGREIVGFDLVEVAPENGRDPGCGWDEIVGARLLYRLAGFALMSRERA